MPASRHGDFLARLPEDWERVPLEKVGSLIGGGTPSRGVPSYWGGDIAWVTPSEITELGGRRKLEQPAEMITLAGLNSSAAKVLPPGSVLVTTRATIGAVAVASGPVATNQGFRSLVPGPKADSNFYYHLIKEISGELRRLGVGSTFDEISRHDLGAILVPRPSLNEQRRIAAVLDAVDAAIDAAAAELVKEELLRVGLREALFSRGLDESGQLRAVTSEQFCVTPIGLVPKSWSITTLERLIDPRRPVVYGILMPGTGYARAGGVPVVQVRDIIEGEVTESDLLLTSPETDAEYRRSRLLPGDLLFSIRGTVGRTAFVPSRLADANIARDTARLAVTGADPVYVREWLVSAYATHFIDLHTIGQAVRGINLGDLRALPVAVPPPKEQSAIAEIICTSDSQMRAQRTRLRKLRLLRDGLASILLSGAVRTPVHDTEPAMVG